MLLLWEKGNSEGIFRDFSYAFIEFQGEKITPLRKSEDIRLAYFPQKAAGFWRLQRDQPFSLCIVFQTCT